jgi:Fe2+ transport system protein FeoA
MVFSFLDGVPLHTEVKVAAIELEAHFVRWLRAVGVEEGATLRILRRGLFGGPLHVRSSTGSELAIHRSLAKAIKVHAADAAPAESPSVRKSGTELVGDGESLSKSA